MKRCAIFDMDGTLIHSQEDFVNAVNALRGWYHMPPLPEATVVSYVGNGMIKLLERSLEGKVADMQEARQKMLELYGQNLVVHTTLYPGVEAGLHQLKQAGFNLAILSNKPQMFCETILKHFQIDELFDRVIGGGTEIPLKPEPMGLLKILSDLKIEDKTAVWMLGDHCTDLEVALRAGVLGVYAAYGFGNPRDKIYQFKVDSFPEFVNRVIGITP